MKKIIVPIILAATLLFGCETAKEQEKQAQNEMKIVGILEYAQVIKKTHKERTRFSPAEYSIVVSKDNQEIELKLFSEDAYKVLHEGLILNIGYTDEYYIKEMKFPQLESEVD